MKDGIVILIAVEGKKNKLMDKLVSQTGVYRRMLGLLMRLLVS